jgi:hypothetical protein
MKQRKIRFELLDRDGKILREGVEQGSINHTSPQEIPRGGRIQIDERFFVLTDEYVCPGAEIDGEVNFQSDNIKVHDPILL